MKVRIIGYKKNRAVNYNSGGYSGYKIVVRNYFRINNQQNYRRHLVERVENFESKPNNSLTEFKV